MIEIRAFHSKLTRQIIVTMLTLIRGFTHSLTHSLILRVINRVQSYPYLTLTMSAGLPTIPPQAPTR